MDKYADVISHTSQLMITALLAGEDGLEERALTLDSDVWRVLRLVGCAVMQGLYAELGRRVVGRAEAKGLEINRRGVVPFSVLFGQIEIESPYLWDAKTRCSARPVQDELGLVSRGRSPAVVRALTDFGAEESFGHSAERFKEHYGWEIGRTSILRLVEGIAVEAEHYVDQRLKERRKDFNEPLAVRPGCDRILVELDGCEIRTGVLKSKPGRERTLVRRRKRRCRQEEWRDVRMGLARRFGDMERTYVGRMASYDEVTEQLFCAAVERGLSTQTKVIGVADGGNGLREALAAKFPGMQFILDRPHLKSHLYETAEALGHIGQRREAWVHGHLDEIDAGQAATVLSTLRAQQRRRRVKRLRQLIGYVKRFADAMSYAHYRDQGLPTGSGEIEAAHRCIPQKRLKISGACWHPDTINPMLALRVLRANGWWADFWQKRPLRAVA